jgi:hypothetical protein
MAVLLVIVIGALGYAGFLAVQSHRRSDREAAYQRGESALRSLALPPGVIDAGSAPDGGVPAGCGAAADTRCLHTSVGIDDVHPLLDQLVAGAHDVCVIQQDPCEVLGRIGGHEAFALAFPHIGITTRGQVPPGAVLWHNGHTYVLGTDITVGLTDS